MAQWERLQQLDSVYIQQLDELYDRDAFPMEVRHYLASWIEIQEWELAAQDYDRALVLLQVLLENLDIQHSRFVQEEAFLMMHNMRLFKHNFQRYQEEPCGLARTILWFLQKEKEILQSADLAQQVQQLHVESNPMESENQRDLERKMAGLRNKVQCMEHSLVCLEEQQDEFDFKYQTHQLEVTADEAVKREQQRALQTLLTRINVCRKTLLSDLVELLNTSEHLLDVLVKEELKDWQRRQQKVCIGAPHNTSLDQLEQWFTCLAGCLFQVRKFLKKLEELQVKLSYDEDPVRAQRPLLQSRADGLLSSLLESSFVVEIQPSMPQGKGPLVLRTNVQFSVKTRILVKFPELNHAMKVNVSMDRGVPQMKGYRRFNVLGSNSKNLNMTESQNGGMVAEFRHLTLKEQKGGGGKGASNISLSVTEELHLISFDTVFQFQGFEANIETFSLPVVIISNSSQLQSAWASILWFNMLSDDPKDVLFFNNCPVAKWLEFGEMLSWQFLSATKRGLDSYQLEMIAFKLFGKQKNYDACNISWSKFSKENSPSGNFTFWVWFDGILVLVKSCLEDLWREGYIMGFVSKAKEKILLKKKQRGTFLLRFSESFKDGRITFTWVDYNALGEPDVKSIQPFTKASLSQIPLQEIVRHFVILQEGSVPVNPLVFLYPDIPKDEAFGKYYSEKVEDNSGYKKYIHTILRFVSNENSQEAKSPMSSDMVEVEGLATGNGLCEGADGLNLDTVPLEPQMTYDPDPMISGALLTTEEDADLLEFLNNPNNFLSSSYSADVPVLSEASLQGLTASSLLLPCVGIYD